MSMSLFIIVGGKLQHALLFNVSKMVIAINMIRVIWIFFKKFNISFLHVFSSIVFLIGCHIM